MENKSSDQEDRILFYILWGVEFIIAIILFYSLTFSLSDEILDSINHHRGNIDYICSLTVAIIKQHDIRIGVMLPIMLLLGLIFNNNV